MAHNTNDEPQAQLNKLVGELTKTVAAQAEIAKGIAEVQGRQLGAHSSRRGSNPFAREDARSDGAPAPKRSIQDRVRDLLRELEEADSAEAQKRAALDLAPALIDLAKVAGGDSFRAAIARADAVEPIASFAGKAAGVGSVRTRVEDLGSRIGVEQPRTGGDRGVRDTNVQTPSANGSPDRSTPALDWAGPDAAKAPGVVHLSNSYAVVPAKAMIDAQAARQSSAPSAKGAPSRPLQDDAAYQLPKAQIDPMTWAEYDAKPVRPGR